LYGEAVIVKCCDPPPPTNLENPPKGTRELKINIYINKRNIMRIFQRTQKLKNMNN
jgi:hypothetical protein